MEEFFDLLFNRPELENYIDWLRLVELDRHTTEYNARTRYFKNTQTLIRSIKELSATRTTDLYFGVAPTIQQKGTKESVNQCSTLWVDYDFKHQQGLVSLSSIQKSLPVKPNIVVYTGSGYHFYWLLDKPSTALNQIEHINRKLAQAINGDKCHNINRILRVPQTINTKSKTRSFIASINKQAYPIDIFMTLFPLPQCGLVSPVFLNTTTSNDQSAPFFRKISPRFMEYIKYGISADTRNFYQGDRSRLDFAVVRHLLDRGFDGTEVVEIFTNNQNHISNKTLECGEQYIVRTIENAYRLLQEEQPF